LLTTLLFFLSILFSIGSVKTHVKSYYVLLLLLETSVLGVFLSLDLFLFYLFFEVGLIPMYFLIGLWGGEKRIFAAVKFFLYTFVGSVLFLISILYLGDYAGDQLKEGIFTTDFAKLMAVALPRTLQFWLFWGFAIAFLIKVPVFPVHTWLPLAHTEAPTAGSVILAGVLLKMGTYGLMRFNLPLFPEASLFYANTMAFLGLIGILYGAMAAMMQSDIKKLIAYSSVAHMGFIMMGIFAFTPEALNGAVLQMVNHGLSTGALFLIVGMIYDRTHTRLIRDYQGIAKLLPVFTFFFMFATLASIGMPGLNGFVGEFLILLGSYASRHLDPWYPILGASGVILAAVYMLWMFRRVMFGELKSPIPSLNDLCSREILVLLPLALLMLWIGLGSSHFLEQIHVTNEALLETIKTQWK
jgi:NADH-quinone oxidoreductase subunit M